MLTNLKIENKNQQNFRLKILTTNNQELGHVYLYLIFNDLHQKPYGLVEDLFVKEKFRQQGLGTRLLKAVIDLAKKNNCYKLIATSRFERELVHQWYENNGFKKYGFEFRIDF